MWSVKFHYLFLNVPTPTPSAPPIGLKLYLSQSFSQMVTPTILKLFIIYLLAYEDGTDSVPKSRHMKFRRRGINQKKTLDIQNKANVWNQEHKVYLQTLDLQSASSSTSSTVRLFQTCGSFYRTHFRISFACRRTIIFTETPDRCGSTIFSS
jgi:hypothetical protein